jgi:hypothetical protein
MLAFLPRPLAWLLDEATRGVVSLRGPFAAEADGTDEEQPPAEE